MDWRTRFRSSRLTGPVWRSASIGIAQGMDSAAALIVDGRLVAAAEEERFSGKKHTGDFPINAIRFCLARPTFRSTKLTRLPTDSTMLPYRDLYLRDEVSTGCITRSSPERHFWRRYWRDLPGFPDRKVHSVGHHLAHAASAAYTSGWTSV